MYKSRINKTCVRFPTAKPVDECGMLMKVVLLWWD